MQNKQFPQFFEIFFENLFFQFLHLSTIILVITLERMELEGSTRSHFEAISIFYRMVTRTGRRSDLIINLSSQMSLTKKFPFFRSHFGAFRVPWHDPC